MVIERYSETLSSKEKTLRNAGQVTSNRSLREIRRKCKRLSELCYHRWINGNPKASPKNKMQELKANGEIRKLFPQKKRQANKQTNKQKPQLVYLTVHLNIPKDLIWMVKWISLRCQSTVLTKALHASFEVSHQIGVEGEEEETLPTRQTFTLASEIRCVNYT